ncbi:MAG: NAD(P)-dependent oxidoreductase [Candidatus Micrarchaeota archaeon]|nr:NAD(P)-dependent oxidoreductase [Candidatus Micrarchaeota archaeon]MDE1848295.1 NAD(P)-dependent oxidoreductase [Candidatus Micrarchaeota archaeon]MDE1864748.1 NAD(P)-dependent oxidoreductase [Candidatus Micrarchaeota archaeon]
MKILLTGNRGYLGSEFVRAYGKDYEIVGYDIKDNLNLLDYESLSRKIKRCDQIVHLAAIPAPVNGKTFEEYFDNNVRATHNIAKAAVENGVKRIIYASSTTIYGIERGIPFKTPITENQAFVSQYITANMLSCRDVDLSYHMSKVMAEQIMAWYGLTKKIQTVALRFGPINKVFLGISVSINNATQAIKLALEHKGELWYEPFSIVDDARHIDTSKAKRVLGYNPEKPDYSADQIHSTLDQRAK